MLNVRTLTTAFLWLLVMLQSSLASAFDGVVSIENQTGYEIQYLYIRHTDSPDWGSDRLGKAVLVPTDKIKVSLDDYPSSIFDVRAEDEDGDFYTVLGIDIAVDDLILTLDHLDSSASADGAFSGYIEVTNDTGYDIYYLYVRHADADGWGSDVLGDDILENGDSFTVDLEGYSSSIFDVKAEDEDGDEYPIFGIDAEVDDLTLTFDDLDNNGSADGFSGYIEVTNYTGQAISHLYISHEDEDWAEDVLGNDILEQGDVFRFDVEGYSSSIFDVKAEDSNGKIYTQFDIDIASDDLALTTANGNKEPTVDGVGRYLDVFNVSGYEMLSLYVSHEDADGWGEELLGGDSLENGESFRVNLEGYPSSIFNVKAIDVDRDVYQVFGIDVEIDDLNLILDYIDDTESTADGFSGYIEVTNATGYDIRHLYISHEDGDLAEAEDVLGEGSLAEGDSFTYDVEGYSSSIFHVEAEDLNGKIYSEFDIDIESNDLTLTRAHTNKEPTVDGVGRYLEVFNVSGYEMHSLYVSHELEEGWGDELLGDDSLEDGEGFRVELEGYSSSIFNVKAIDIDQDVYQVFGIDVEVEDLNLTLDHIDNGPSEGDYSGSLYITNNTGYDINYLYVSHENSDDWGDDVLGDQVLDNGDSFRVELDGYYSSLFDIRAEDEDGDDYTVFSFDVDVGDLTLTFDDYGDGSSSNGSFDGYVVVSNYTDQDLYCLHIKHEDDSDWGDNLLEGDSLEAYDSYREELDGYPSSLFDIRAEGPGGDIYTVYGLDVESEDLDLDRGYLDNAYLESASVDNCDAPGKQARGRGRGRGK